MFSFLFSTLDEWEELRRTISPPAHAHLAKLAEEARNEAAPSVTSKIEPAPSGNPNDYQSLGIYWWPDPSKPGGTPYIRRDGEINPEVARFDRPSLDRMTQGVSCFILRAWCDGDSAYYREAARWLRVWFLDPATRMNPHLQFAQHIPGQCEGRGIGLIETDIFVFLLDILPLLVRSGQWPEDECSGVFNWFREYQQWFRASEHGRRECGEHNNHGTWYDLQVMAYARATGESRILLRQWENHSRSRIISQITADGEQPFENARTLSFNYNIFNLTAFMGIFTLAARELDAFSERFPTELKRLRCAYEQLVPYMASQDQWPHPQIKPFTGQGLRWLTARAPRVLNEEGIWTATPPPPKLRGWEWQCLAPQIGEAERQPIPTSHG
ncbi:MAG: alginate lyase family protein [Kiritimatiellia bacterium]